MCHSADVVSRRVRRRRRQFATVGALLIALLVYLAFFSGGGPKTTPSRTHRAASSHESFPAHSPLNPDWKGNGKAVTLAFGGDVHFEGAVGLRLTKECLTMSIDAPSLESAVAMEDRNQILCTQTQDVREAMSAFKEKRRPEWRDQ